MQQLNYFTLKALAEWLRPRLEGAFLAGAFTQERDELIVSFASPEHETYLRAGVRGDFQYLAPQPDFKRARANTADLWPELAGRGVAGCRVESWDRMIWVDLEGGQRLLFKMHGARSNVLWLENKSVREIFRHTIAEDADFVPPAQPKTVPQTRSDFDALWAITEGEPEQRIRRVFPVFDKPFVEAVMEEAAKSGDYFAAARSVMQAAEDGVFYLGERGEATAFLLFPRPDYELTAFRDVGAALHLFMRRALGKQHYLKQYRRTEKIVQSGLKKAKGRLNSARKSLRKLETQRSFEELGHILMGHLHALAEGAESVELEDFYNGGTVKIALDPDLSPHKNAEKYYEKHRAAGKKLAHAKNALEEAEARALEWEAVAEAFAEVDQIKKLRAFHQAYQDKLEKQNRAAKAEAPYRRFFMDGWEIRVGKSARKNDELTARHCRKHDLWLHAKDYSGSHVVLRREPGQQPPLAVLEYAAGLAAWFSKGRKNNLVPVSYCERRYVRKPRGLPPGAVRMEREEVIMIEPEAPEG